jgi:endoglucanase
MWRRTFISLVFSTSLLAGSNDIRINQVGYYPQSAKRFVVIESGSAGFEIRDGRGVVRYKGQLKDNGFWDASGEHVRVGDFTEFKEPGRYTISVPDKGESHPFQISPDLYGEALKAAMKTYYFQRASMPLEEKYAGRYARAMGHPDDSCAYHPSSGRTEGRRSSPKGWYDAGDYNKYVVNAGVTVGILLGAAELLPGLFPDGSLNIPESGNGRRDLLDEVHYELEWLLTMQDEDGGVFFKLTTKGFPGFIMPAEDKAERFVVGKSTASALNFAAVAAQAARVYRDVDKALAGRCLSGAEKAWFWARKNDHVVYTNPPDIQTGAYSHTQFDNEFFWAAAELLITTGKEEYLDYVRKHLKPADMIIGENWRNFVRNLGEVSLANIPSRLTDSERKKIRESIVLLADRLREKMQSVPYRVPLDRFEWGSNSDILDEGIVSALAFKYTKDTKYLDALVEIVDYIFGKNATGYSFVTGFGAKTPMHPHHRPSEADKIAEPIPGFVVGGPNTARQDGKDKVSYGVEYPNLKPAGSYTDQLGSYASNEIAINWNAPLVYVLGFLQDVWGRQSVEKPRANPVDVRPSSLIEPRP